MAKIKEGDFVELEFTGRIANSGKVFDTTDEELAKEEEIYNPKQGSYGSVKIVVGEGHLVPGLEEALEGKEPGNEYDIEVAQEDAFGKKDSDMLKIVPKREFDKQGIKPFPGLEVQIDGQPGVVRTVSGGRTIVDFNHPLAGKDLEYEIKINKIIEDPEEKMQAVMDLMGIPYENLTVEGKEAEINFNHPLPDQARNNIEEEIEKLTDLDVTFNAPEPEEDED